MMIRICLYLVVLVFVGCKSGDKQDIENLWQEWKGKVVHFPQNSIFTIYGKDTVKFNMDGSCKILLYVDSIGCTGCKLQLQQWKGLMEEFFRLSKKEISFVFYVSPKDKTELELLLQSEEFVYPICIDKKDELNKLNCFPENEDFHTLLLDKENKVVLIGNPINNMKIKELYLKILRSGK